MAREGIYVGNKEVTHRYIGAKLVWVKIRLLFSGDVSINYYGSKQITLNKDFSQKNIRTVEINGKEISASKIENKQGKTYVTFTESLKEFERKTGFNRYRSFYDSIPIKVYGG